MTGRNRSVTVDARLMASVPPGGPQFVGVSQRGDAPRSGGPLPIAEHLIARTTCIPEAVACDPP
jgi:hypothetical protein